MTLRDGRGTVDFEEGMEDSCVGSAISAWQWVRSQHGRVNGPI
jgi:hypothetical protein